MYCCITLSFIRKSNKKVTYVMPLQTNSSHDPLLVSLYCFIFDKVFILARKLITNFIFNGGRHNFGYNKHLKKTNFELSLRPWRPLIWQGRVCEAFGNYRLSFHPPDPPRPQNSGNFKTVKFCDTFKAFLRVLS